MKIREHRRYKCVGDTCYSALFHLCNVKTTEVLICRVPHTPLSLEELKSGQKALTIIHALSVCVCLPPPALPLPAHPLSHISSLSALLCHGAGAREWGIIIRYSAEHSFDFPPARPQFHISSWKMPGTATAGSGFKWGKEGWWSEVGGNQAHRPICRKMHFKGYRG